MSLAFELIILSALFHAGWNVLVKLANNKLSFTTHIHIAATLFLTVFLLVFYPESFVFDKATVTYALVSGFFFALYQIFVAVSYKYADVSMIYPITTSSPLFIIIWAYFILDERIAVSGFFGILLIIAGCFVMNSTKGSNKTAAKGIIFAVLAALIYSFGAMADKLGVIHVNTLLYVYLMTAFSTCFTIIIVGFYHRGTKQTPIEWKLILIAGFFVACSSVSYRFGLIDIPISYASSLRQVSSFFALLIGIFFFKESYGIRRAIGCAVIISGILLIRLGL